MSRPLRLLTWNINSIRARLDLLARLVQETGADVVCLQETKVSDDKFPTRAVRKLGFEFIETNGTSAWHGVAILSRRPLHHVEQHAFCGLRDGRHLSAIVDHPDSFRIDNLYVPAGGDIPDRTRNQKFDHKLNFVDEMGAVLKDAHMRAPDHRHVAVGDLNIAPHANDVWSHRQLLKVVSHTPIEVEKHEQARQLAGLEDAVRKTRGMDVPLYTWWSYRSRDWRASNRGRRLDHIWASPALMPTIQSIAFLDHVRDWEKTSDHIPLLLQLE